VATDAQVWPHFRTALTSHATQAMREEDNIE